MHALFRKTYLSTPTLMNSSNCPNTFSLVCKSTACWGVPLRRERRQFHANILHPSVVLTEVREQYPWRNNVRSIGCCCSFEGWHRRNEYLVLVSVQDPGSLVDWIAVQFRYVANRGHSVDVGNIGECFREFRHLRRAKKREKVLQVSSQ